MPDSDHQWFRAAVGVLLIDQHGMVYAFERSDVAGAWQLVQGGLGADEPPLAAALRELREETGVRSDHVELVDEHPDWLAYELPPQNRSRSKGRGQVLRWFLFRMKDSAPSIDLSTAETQEFRSVKKVTMHDLLHRVVLFRRAVYSQLASYFGEYLAQGSRDN